MPRKARPDLAGDGWGLLRGSGLRRNHPHVLGPLLYTVSGDVRVPGVPGGDNGVQLPPDRGGDDGLGLGGLEPVGGAAGQVPVAGRVHPVVL